MPHKFNFIFGWTDFQDIYTEVVNRFPNGSKFVEIGSFLGKSAVMMGELIKESGKDLTLFCVDLFPTLDELNELEGIGAGQGGPVHGEQKYIRELPKSLLDTFVENIRKNEVDDVIIPIKCDSHRAAKIFEDNSLEFVFVDGCHDYDGVMKDLVNWWPKVKIGGMFCGHDIEVLTVNNAVKDFVKDKNINFEKRLSSWVIYKND